jgi:hypothetical protein
VTTAPIRRHVDDAMVKAVARAFRWREMLENGTHATIAEIAATEKINASYVGRVLRLTLLAPDIIEAILGGRQPAGLQLEALLRRFPVGWWEQRKSSFYWKNAISSSPRRTRDDVEFQSRSSIV